MPSVETMIHVALAGLALSMSPGPSMLYVLSRSVGQSRAAGLASALGLGLGGVVLAALAAFGLATLFQQTAWAENTLSFAGSLYLIWLGFQMIWDIETQGAAELHVEQIRRHSFAAIVWQGVLVEVLNPKTILFFLLFIPPFVEISSGEAGNMDVVWQMLILGALVPLTAVPSDVVVAFVGGSLAQTVNGNRLIRRGLAWLGGLFLIGIGVNLLIGIGESLLR